MQDGLSDRLRECRIRHEEISQLLADPEVSGDAERLERLGREYGRLTKIIEQADRLRAVEETLAEDRKLLEEEDEPELLALAREEVRRLEDEQVGLERGLLRLVVPPDPLDQKDAIMEVRAGTGGEEAALFAHDLFRMYTRFVERKGWAQEVVDLHQTELGGLREVIFIVRGDAPYGHLRYESGVHRVQRVPETEAGGRIHTSAATVAVLPEAEEVDVEIAPDDLRIDVFRSSGPGGQSVNTADSAVRITHTPTDLVVQCQDERSQHQNRLRAMQVLRARLLDLKVREQEEARAKSRKAQVGTGDRSAKIRTYNFPQNRVTDHRITKTVYRLADVLDGDLDEFIDELRLVHQQERINGRSMPAESEVGE